MFAGIFIIALLIFIFTSGVDLTGHATNDAQVGNLSASVQTYIACTWSSDSLDVDFGSLLNPGTNNINATGNDLMAPGTSYNVTVSPLTTSTVNVTISGNDLIDGANVLGVGNVTWVASSTSATDVAMIEGNSIAMTGSPTNIASDAASGSTNHYRFWLDIPSSIVAGNYVGNYTINCQEA